VLKADFYLNPALSGSRMQTTGSKPLKFAIIGAGAAGLVSLKTALEYGHECTVFEATNSIGGYWDQVRFFFWLGFSSILMYFVLPTCRDMDNFTTICVRLQVVS
jgi:phytoene dehydrogenase-like protein